MFGISDLPKFFLAFFLVMPLISILHEAGHVFFAWLMGGKNIKVSIGTGKPIFNWGMIEVRKYYFWYGLCTFENLKINRRWSNILVFGGGSLFNLIGVLTVMILVEQQLMDTNMFTYQFTYFSLYYIFFALFPMPYPDGNYSDGKIILDLLRNRKYAVMERVYRVQWNSEKKQWYVLNHEKEFVEAFENEEEASSKAREVAKNYRPSRVVNIKDGEEKEIHNYPRIPL
ncbi:M50 family metallopeptidase [Salinimicrobium terrae]|uniref:M50 family metallopeptidase n=1 Tax=Salinimicrobium terrae TaxID=470866 RepID=UPI00041E2F09|nr:M50 family metallopeptidase [Salinimicrobium terrae]